MVVKTILSHSTWHHSNTSQAATAGDFVYCKLLDTTLSCRDNAITVIDWLQSSRVVKIP
jgi:hypothetical protein